MVSRRAAGDRSYEGSVAKDETSLYEGGPTRRWLKIKVPGWTVGDARWTRRISIADGARGT